MSGYFKTIAYNLSSNLVNKEDKASVAKLLNVTFQASLVFGMVVGIIFHLFVFPAKD